jgi:hypothetical protein
VVKDSFFAGSRDGCIDTKAGYMLIKDSIAVGCKRNYRLWQDNHPNGPSCEGCISYQPTGDAHFFVNGDPATAINTQVYSSNGANLAVLDNGGSISFDGLSGTLASQGDLNAPATNNSVTFGQAFQTPQAPNHTPFSP